MSNAKAIGGGFLALIVVLILGCALFLGTWFWMYLTAEPKGIAEAERELESAPSRITNYEHFYDLCAEVQGLEASLNAQEDILNNTNSHSGRERIRSNIAGITAQRSRLIAQYNADARKSYTKARFLGEDLPKKLNPKEDTTCD